MNQNTEIEGKELPSCLTGCALVFFIAPVCAFILSWLTYQIQASSNRVPLSNGIYDFTYIFTIPLGSFVGCVATWAFWWLKPNKFWLSVLIIGILLVFVGLAILFFNPITDPNDPSFGSD